MSKLNDEHRSFFLNFDYEFEDMAIKNIRDNLINSPNSKKIWDELANLIRNRQLKQGQPLDLVHHIANKSINKNTDDEAYIWLNLVVDSVEVDSDIINQYYHPDGQYTVGFNDNGQWTNQNTHDAEFAINILRKLDNKKLSDLHIKTHERSQLIIHGSVEGRVTITLWNRNDNDIIRNALMDTAITNSNTKLKITESDRTRLYPINQTIPIEIAETVIRYYFEHKSIINHGYYEWVKIK